MYLWRQSPAEGRHVLPLGAGTTAPGRCGLRPSTLDLRKANGTWPENPRVSLGPCLSLVGICAQM